MKLEGWTEEESIMKEISRIITLLSILFDKMRDKIAKIYE